LQSVFALAAKGAAGAPGEDAVVGCEEERACGMKRGGGGGAGGAWNDRHCTAGCWGGDEAAESVGVGVTVVLAGAGASGDALAGSATPTGATGGAMGRTGNVSASDGDAADPDPAAGASGAPRTRPPISPATTNSPAEIQGR
jgi:hypothetical protein